MLTEVAATPVLGVMMLLLSAFVSGTKKVKTISASFDAVVPLTEEKRRVSVPPGTVVLGVLIAVVVKTGVPRIDVESRLTNCRLSGNTSITSRFVMA